MVKLAPRKMRSIFRGFLTCLLQLLLERIAVHPVVVSVQLVDEVLDGQDRLARHHPERLRLAAAPVLLAGVPLGEAFVRRLDRAGVLERLALPFLAEDFPDHAASLPTVAPVGET